MLKKVLTGLALAATIAVPFSLTGTPAYAKGRTVSITTLIALGYTCVPDPYTDPDYNPTPSGYICSKPGKPDIWCSDNGICGSPATTPPPTTPVPVVPAPPATTGPTPPPPTVAPPVTTPPATTGPTPAPTAGTGIVTTPVATA
jgi:hypothetical protein